MFSAGNSVLFHAVLCWGGSITVDDTNKINKMIRKDGSIIGFIPDSLKSTYEILHYEEDPLKGIFNGLRS